MFDENNIQKAVDIVKRHRDITWDDEHTNQKIIDIIKDAEITLNHKLGTEADYITPSAERRLFLSYIDYVFNDCQNEFDSTYLNEIYQLRQKYEVEAYKNEQE